ncbi:hypothetical protein Agub_g8749, partial [Astrephomene gubernaculifera]
MSANEVLDSLQRRLQSANAPTVARHAVAGIFATLRKPATSAEARTSAISFCLSRPNKVVIQEAADQLLSLALSGGIPTAETVEALLSGLSTAGPSTAPPLADALCRLLVASATAPAPPVHPPQQQPYQQQPQQQPSQPPPQQQLLYHPGRWTSHPLVCALLACPSAAT